MKFIDQKYYHFVILREKNIFRLTQFVEWLNGLPYSKMKIAERNEEPIVQTGYEVIPYLSSESYSYRDDYKYSSKKNENPMFCYDIHYKLIKIGDWKAMIIVFPFSTLALDIFNKLSDEQNTLFKKLEYFTVEISSVIKLARLNLLKTELLTKMGISNVELAFKGETHLSTIKLSGKSPLKSLTYRALLRTKNNLLKDNVLMIRDSDGKTIRKHEDKRIAISCELLSSEKRNLRAKIHIDKYGNYKFYAHINFVNMAILPYVFIDLESLGLLKETSILPLERESEYL